MSQNATNKPSKLNDILESSGQGDRVQSAGLSRVATLPTQSAPIGYTPELKGDAEFGAQLAAAQELYPNVSENVRGRYEAIRASLSPSRGATITYVDKMVTVIPASVREVPNALPLRIQRAVLKEMLGPELYPKVKKWSAAHGFEKLALWLNQRVYPLAKSRRARTVPLVTHNYIADIDNNPSSDICTAIRKVFGEETLFELQGLAQLRNASILDTLSVLTRMAVEESEEDRKASLRGPTAYDGGDDEV